MTRSGRATDETDILSDSWAKLLTNPEVCIFYCADGSSRELTVAVWGNLHAVRAFWHLVELNANIGLQVDGVWEVQTLHKLSKRGKRGQWLLFVKAKNAFVAANDKPP